MKKGLKLLKERKKFRYVVMSIALLASVAVAYAASVPNTFTTGTAISSSEVNANFNYLAERSWDINGTYLSYIRWK